MTATHHRRRRRHNQVRNNKLPLRSALPFAVVSYYGILSVYLILLRN